MLAYFFRLEYKIQDRGFGCIEYYSIQTHEQTNEKCGRKNCVI